MRLRLQRNAGIVIREIFHYFYFLLCILVITGPSMVRLNSLVLIVFLTAAGCGNGDSHSETEQHRDAALRAAVRVPEFDPNRAFEYLVAQTDFGPRNPGSDGHQQCLQYLTLEMQKFAEIVNQQTFRHTGYDGRSYRMTNIIASFNPESTRRILLGAHWDTRPRAERDPDPRQRDEPILGANDGASGVAVLLEIARQMHYSPPPIGVDILLFDGEDYGREGDLDNYCLGSKYFARNMPAGYRPGFGIVIDMVGDREARFPKEGHSRQYAPGVVDLIWDTAQSLNLSQFEERMGAAIYDDHLPLNRAGIPTALIIDSDLIGYDGDNVRRRYWHTTSDTPGQCSPESLDAVGRVLLDIIYRQPA
jgi:glutaminyl-peptide cyclotransferase